MLIIVDYRTPQDVLTRLRQMGEVELLQTHDVVYQSIEGHVDIFLCASEKEVVVAPQTPSNIISALKRHKIPYRMGLSMLGKEYPSTIYYNAVVTENSLLHNSRYTDPIIVNVAGKRNIIHLEQGYTRCNVVALKGDRFITGDRGIERTLRGLNKELFFFSSEKINLQSQRYGFIGGCCGINQNTIYFSGDLSLYPESDMLTAFVEKLGYEIVSLGKDFLTDIGGIFFLNSSDFS